MGAVVDGISLLFKLNNGVLETTGVKKVYVPNKFNPK